MSRPIFAVAACLLLASVPCNASADVQLLVNGAGLLTGAQNVAVGTGLYDVAFVDDTCAAVFPGCSTLSSNAFLFTSASVATLAAQALLDQVLVGSFDSAPSLTSGCNYPECGIYTPFDYYVVSENQYVQIVGAYNYATADDVVMQGITSLSSTAGEDGSVWAVWSPASTAVPEPATLLLLATGLAGLGGVAWRRKARE